MKIKSINEAKNLKGKTVFLRADFNVPIKQDRVKEDYKIIAGLSTIRFLLRYGCKVIVSTHLGDPGGKKNLKLTTLPVAKRLEKLLGKKITFINDSIGSKVETLIKKINPGQVVFLENLRFHAGEEKNDKNFAKQLARLADIYVNNAFAVSHREHASVSAIKKYLPAYAGLLVEAELKNINKALKPEKPLIVVIGGAKISTKLPIIKKFIKSAEHILVGGAIANDFLKNLGFEVGKSLVGKDGKISKQLVGIYKKYGNKKIILPLDFLVSDNRAGSGKLTVKKVTEINKKDYIYDIGPQTILFYSRYLKKAKTIVWNGPMGLFENEKFKHGTLSVARVIASHTSGKAFGVVGGGETIEALKLTRMIGYIDWVSTGGGAMLDYLAGEKMPGLKGIVR